MAVITAEGISALAVELLARTVVLPRTIAAVPGTEFAGPNGSTITVRVRLPRTSRKQASPGATITYDAQNEVGVPVVVEHLYDGVKLSDEDLTLNIADFGAQILAPQVASIAAGAEDQVATVMNALAADIDLATDGSDFEAAVLDARELMSRAEVPVGDRFLAVSPEVATFALQLDNLSDVAAAGSPSALRDAVIGRYRGFTVVESAALEEGSAVAYHRCGFVWANRAPAIPQGAASAAVRVDQGIALRAVMDFDPGTLSDVSVLSTFAGASAVYEDGETATDARRFVKMAYPVSA